MSIKNMENINVYNYSSSVIVISCRDKQYTLNPAANGVPSMVPLTPSEIEYFNSNSPAIRNGAVRFAKEIEEAVYYDLRITNWKDILFEDVIEDIVLHPTLDKLQKIVDVKNVAIIERVKGVLTSLKNAGEDISTRVDKIINVRYNEISHNKMKTDIVLSPKDAVIASAVVEDVTGLKAENEAMKDKLANMEAMIAELMKNKDDIKDDGSDTEKEKTASKKAVGRPPKTDK